MLTFTFIHLADAFIQSNYIRQRSRASGATKCLAQGHIFVSQ